MKIRSFIYLSKFRLNRPVRCMLDRDEDMMVSGTRHPFLGKYKVGFTKEGKITACDIDIYNNGGHTLDLSGAVSGIIGSILGFFFVQFFSRFEV